MFIRWKKFKYNVIKNSICYEFKKRDKMLGIYSLFIVIWKLNFHFKLTCITESPKQGCEPTIERLGKIELHTVERQNPDPNLPIGWKLRYATS